MEKQGLLEKEVRVLGTVKQEKGLAVFVPINFDGESIILIQNKLAKSAVGKRACCVIKPVNKSGAYSASIERVFGIVDDPISENIAIAYEHGFTTSYPEEVMNEVSQIPQFVTEAEKQSRLDLTDKYFMPWDDIECKDKDDAIYAEKTADGYKVYVAIADVSHYVKMGSAIDKEAFSRSTSCYLGSGVYPMLPPELSNGICSLNEGVERLSLCAIIDIDKNGKILNYDFKKAVINIKKSIDYSLAEKIHLCQDNKHIECSEAKPYVDLMYEIAEVLATKLDNRNRINFSSVEPLFRFNKERNKVEDVLQNNIEKSHMVVEQFMVLANEATAQFFIDNKLDGIYRIHEKPDAQKIQKLKNILASLNVPFFVGANNKDISTLLEFVKTHPADAYLEDIILLSMKKAKYSSVNKGHFGLASTGYTHFTSPIRRYSDLIAHRIISQYLVQKKSNIKSSHIEQFCNHINYQERQADKAEIESNQFLACLWAKNHIGEEKEGTIIWFSSDYLTIRHNAIDIQVPLFEDFVTSQDGLSIEFTNSSKQLKLGEKVKFRLDSVDIENREIVASIPSLKFQDEQDNIESY